MAARSGATVRTDMGELAGLLALISASGRSTLRCWRRSRDRVARPATSASPPSPSLAPSGCDVGCRDLPVRLGWGRPRQAAPRPLQERPRRRFRPSSAPWKPSMRPSSPTAWWSQVPDPQRSYALAALAEHRAARDWLRDQLGAAGLRRPAPLPPMTPATRTPRTLPRGWRRRSSWPPSPVGRGCRVVPPAQRVYAPRGRKREGTSADLGCPSQAFPGTVDAGASPSSSPTLSGSASDSSSPSDLNSTPGSARSELSGVRRHAGWGTC